MCWHKSHRASYGDCWWTCNGAHSITHRHIKEEEEEEDDEEEEEEEEDEEEEEKEADEEEEEEEEEEDDDDFGNPSICWRFIVGANIGHRFLSKRVCARKRPVFSVCTTLYLYTKWRTIK